jgi:hypothetical protein
MSRDNPELVDLDDPMDWQLPVENPKAVMNWSCDWGLREDNMLLIGVWKHGHQNWENIENDPELGLKGYFFLEDEKEKAKAKGKPKEERYPDDEKKIRNPSSMHLIRRADYLLRAMREKDDGGEMLRAKASTSTSKAPNNRKKVPKKRLSDVEESEAESLNEDQIIHMTFGPIQPQVTMFAAKREEVAALDANNKEDRVKKFKILKEGFELVGFRIYEVLDKMGDPDDYEKMESILWEHAAANYWPLPVPASELLRV